MNTQMNSHIELPIGSSLSTAWGKVKGSKGSFWAGLVIIFVIMIILGFLSGWYKTSAPVVSGLLNFVAQVVNYLLSMGLLYVGIQRAFDSPINYQLMFRTFESNIILRIIGLYLIQIAIYIPFILLFILPVIFQIYVIHSASSIGMYLLVALFYLIVTLAFLFIIVRLMLAIGFVLERGTNPWQAIKFSFQATEGNVLSLIAILLIQTVILIISAIPLGIGLIWTLPFAYILYGVIYRTLSVTISRQ